MSDLNVVGLSGLRFMNLSTKRIRNDVRDLSDVWDIPTTILPLGFLLVEII